MKTTSPREQLKTEFRHLFRAMDFIAERMNKARGKQAERYYEVYQQLAVSWEFLGLRCKHWDGYRKTRNGKFCKICGIVKGHSERWILLPRKTR